VNERILVINAFASVTAEKLRDYQKFVEYLSEHDRDYLMIAVMLMDRPKRAKFFATFTKVMQKIAGDISKYLYG
jgi:dihydrodipicolinate synthase/N-acetylneuraminate lyase